MKDIYYILPCFSGKPIDIFHELGSCNIRVKANDKKGRYIRRRPRKKSENGRQSKKLQMQGARILRNEAYLKYVAMTRDEAQRSRWTFYEAVKKTFEKAFTE